MKFRRNEAKDWARETMRGGRSELAQPGETPGNKSKGGLDKDYAFQYSYGISEVLTIAVPRLYGGSSSELQPGSKTAAAFAEKTGMSEDQADEYARGMSAYWGPQGGTAGAVYFGAIICVLFIFGLVYYKGWHSQWLIAATILGVLLAWVILREQPKPMDWLGMAFVLIGLCAVSGMRLRR